MASMFSAQYNPGFALFQPDPLLSIPSSLFFAKGGMGYTGTNRADA
jgi:hypothetical protein